MSKSLAMVDRAGAMMVETMIRLNPVAESTSVTAHFRPVDQSRGLSGSYGNAKATRYGSSCFVAGIGVGRSVQEIGAISNSLGVASMIAS